jgi:hypothetical protein
MKKTDRPKVRIDRILKRDLHRVHRSVRGLDGRMRAIAPIDKTWMNGVTLNVTFIGGTASEKATVREQAGWWMEVANLSFVFGNSPDAEIRIAFDQNDGAWSYIGTDCKEIPKNEPTMNLGFLDGGTAAHEFGHAIGLAHEHQNPAGGIQWNEQVVISELAKPPNSWDEEMVRHNVLNKYSVDQIKGTKFDPDSIMLYFFPASWTLNGIGTKENDILSSMDKEFIAGAQMYPKPDPDGPGPEPSPVKLDVNAKKRTQASIGMFGEEDLYLFTADSKGKYVIDTRGPTDIVMKLFGPGSKTALIAEDDDSGYASNARIAADLTAGDYFVQIRHYNIKSGTGEYSIKVSRK